MQFQDYYAVLGVPRGADEKEIKRAYRELARKYHPDVNQSGDAEERFKAINEAYQVLSDPEKREKYDRFGADWERYQAADANGMGANDFAQWFTGQGAGPNINFEYRTSGGEGFSDFFETLFGSSFGGATQRGRRRRTTVPRRGQDHEYPIEVGLKEAFAGTTRVFDLQVPSTCPECGGTGIVGGGLCPVCGGSGTIAQRSRIEVSIPAGIREGQKVRVSGKGAAGIDGGPAGDVYLRVSIKPDRQFTLEGNDLKTEVDVPLYAAILGGEVIVKTMTGKVALTIPPETQNGKVFRLRRQGWPVAIGSSERGDLLAKVNVVLPTTLSDQERDLFERLREIRTPGSVTANA